MALDGLAALLTTLQQVRDATLNQELTPAMILACRVDRTRLVRDVVHALRERLGEQVLATQVRDSIRLAERRVANSRSRRTPRRRRARTTTEHSLAN